MCHIYYNNLPDLITRKPEFDQYLKDEHKITDFIYWHYVIYTNDTVFMVDSLYFIKILILK